jgi:heme exporter protein B
MLRKELRAELRSRQGLTTGVFFSFLAVVAVAMATYNIKIAPTLGAGLIWVVLIFAGIANLTRTFIGEEENGTADLLRMTSDPHTVYWGKAIFNAGLMLATAFVLAGITIVFMSLPIPNPGLLVVSLAAGAIAISGAVTICSALAARALHRHSLVAVVALPLTIPVAVWGVTSLRVALGEGMIPDGQVAAIGLLAYGIVSNAIGPFIYAAQWKS